MSSSSVMTTIKLETVIYKEMQEICRKRNIDFNDLLTGMLYLVMLFDIDVDEEETYEDRRSFTKALDGWIKLHQRR